jgi:D-alanyl-D-alanine carboxypeptidase
MDMLKQAKNDGISLEICSPYRTHVHQVELFEKKINRFMNRGYSYLEAYRLSSQAVTVPGSSEHEIGLALDIYAPDYKQLNAGFGDTDEGKWLAAHCAEYGFILRYPLGKEEITGIEFEPWHFRYVGREAAVYIMENHLSLEEFTEEWQAYLAGWEAAGGDFLRLLHDRARLNPVTVIGVGDDGEEELSIYY